MNRLILFFSILILQACTVHKSAIYGIDSAYTNVKLDTLAMQTWEYKDIVSDSIPGISLDRAYLELLKNKKGKEVIVAVIDTQMDINHEDLKQAFWVNTDEIPNNGMDDDDNGYVDDVHGWNFIGNTKGESIFRTNFEYVRLVKKYQNKYKDLSIDSIAKKDTVQFKIYKKALKEYNKWFKMRKHNVLMFTNWRIRYANTKKVLSLYFPKEDYTIKKLQEIKTTDTIVLKEIKNMLDHIKWKQSDTWAKKELKYERNFINYYLNIDLKDRELVGDNVNDIRDTKYGYHNVSISQEKLVYHATYIGGVLGANRSNAIGIKGISSTIKIMPLVVSCNGDEYDKDIALAIRYAVDNGARIINMSSKKDFSIHAKWVTEALQYAEQRNVLFVHGTGNDTYNIDKVATFPTDTDKNGTEILTNFINVGSSSYHVNKKLFSYYSNYGKENVDLFAPGEEIYTTSLNNHYRFKDGTSMATPMVSGVAALILSHYPKLKAYEVKEIVLASGVSYNFDVEIRIDRKKVLVPFSSLSKTGKILNAYNALLLAKHYKKWKLGKWNF